MGGLFQLTLIVIVSLGIRVLLACFGLPRRLTELATALAIVIPVAVGLQFSLLYTMMDLLSFGLSMVLIGLFLVALWYHVLQPMFENAEVGGSQGLSFNAWNLRWDYLSVFVLAIPVFLLILTYHYYADIFDLAIARLLPLAVLVYVYYYGVLKKW